MKNSIKILIGLALSVIASQAQALLITPADIDGVACTNTTCWSDVSPTNPDAADVSDIVGVADLVSLYKAEVGTPDNPAVVEEGPFASSYDTTFSNAIFDPADALISYVAGSDSISCPECFLLVKGAAAHTPIWYIFDIRSWDGLVDIDITGFWPDQGAISHVTIFGKVADVPEPGMIGLLSIGLLGMFVARHRMKL